MYRLKQVSKGMIAAITFSVIFALLIAYIPTLGGFKYKYEVPAFRQQKNFILSDDNIVDYIGSFTTEMKIKKVIWNTKSNSLAIDLMIERDKKIDAAAIYQELYTIIKKGLVESANVDEVLIRVMVYDNSQIFLAISAQKDDIIKNQKMELEQPNDYKGFLDKYFGINFGSSLKEE